MFSWMPERVTASRSLLAGGMAAAMLALSGPAIAATPVPLAPCAIGAQRLNANTPLAVTRRAIAGAFPRATFQDGADPDGETRRVTVREGGETLMIVHYYPRTPGRLLAMIDLTSSRFELMPGVRPGVPLAVAARALGPIELGFAPDIGVESIHAPGLTAVASRWEAKGCVVNPRLGPGARVGLYAAGASETRRYRPNAMIREFEVTF